MPTGGASWMFLPHGCSERFLNTLVKYLPKKFSATFFSTLLELVWTGHFVNIFHTLLMFLNTLQTGFFGDSLQLESISCKTFIQIFAQKQLLHCIWKWDGQLPLHPALLLSWFQKVTSSSLYCTNAAPATKRPTRNARLTKNKTRVSLKHAKYCGDEICPEQWMGHGPCTSGQSNASAGRKALANALLSSPGPKPWRSKGSWPKKHAMMRHDIRLITIGLV